VPFWQLADNKITVKSRLPQRLSRTLDLAGSFETANGKNTEIREEHGTHGRETHTECWGKTSRKKAASKA
jgi:hypothetical protein